MLYKVITGVLIWLEARKKNVIPEKERRFCQGVGHIYLSICFSMLPLTGFALSGSVRHLFIADFLSSLLSVFSFLTVYVMQRRRARVS